MRNCILAFITIALAACQSGRDQFGKLSEPVAPLYQTDQGPFYHGVASGDPLSDRVIIWTRVTPADSLPVVEVEWEMAEDEVFQTVVQKETVRTSPERDYTVKIDVTGLDPNQYYYYRFKALDRTSPVGRTKTLPRETTDSLTFAVVSCSNWQHGYFNAYDRIAEREVDAVIHLGDYIYEYGSGNSRMAERLHLPDHEIVTLSDYRTRYSQYHLDGGLRKRSGSLGTSLPSSFACAV